MEDSISQPEPIDSQWCLVGNIVSERLYGEGGLEIRQGTKHFSAGTKVYCLPAQWGDGYNQIIIIGRHRGSKQFKTMIISSDWVTNWRAKVVFITLNFCVELKKQLANHVGRIGSPRKRLKCMSNRF